MNYIGRKLYIKFGGIIVGLEKVLVTPENEDSCKLTDDCKLAIFDIYSQDGIKVEKYVGTPNVSENTLKYLGYSVEEYWTLNYFWASKDEFDEIKGKMK